MGGGDLNLKKSWHPCTMKNMEKVWKAEQQQNHEEKKIAELKKEIRMEKDLEDIKKYAIEQGIIEKKDDKKLDWMYKGPNQLVSREEYLLGRPIDKSFEQMVQAEKGAEQNQLSKNHVEHECIPPSLRFFSGNEQVDLARKMQEDPLYAIKKKELETRNQLLKNPVKLKQLRQLLEEQLKSKTEKKQKKKKYKNSMDSDEAQLDTLLTAKYIQLKDRISNEDLMKSMNKIKHRSKKKLRKKSKDFSSESESEETVNEDINKSKKRKKSRENSSSETRKYKEEKCIQDINKEERKKQRRSEGNGNHSSNRNRSNSPNYKRRSTTYRNRKQVDCSRDRESSNNKNKHNSRNETEEKYFLNKFDNKDRWNSKKKQHLSEEEKERRRQEMIANATWRDKERERNVKKYCEEEKKEIDSGKVYNQDFIRKQLAVAAEVGTVATRIKANINNIQRSGRAMDTNFAKR